MRSLHFILKDGKPIPATVMEWAEWMEKNEKHIAENNFDGVRVSTVFLGLDHNFHIDKPPILYETMIFGGKYDQYQDRYETVEQAIVGHLYAVNLVEGE